MAESILGAATVNPLMARQVAKWMSSPKAGPILPRALTSWEELGPALDAYLKKNFPTDSPEAVSKAAFNTAMGVGPLATVFHGSPHLFDKFDMGKVGTGEGAQAYGHGLYFAEKDGVAKSYADKLGKRGKGNSLTDDMGLVEFNGKPLVKQFDIDAMPEIVELAKTGNTRGLEDFARYRLARWEQNAGDQTYQFRDYATQKVDSYRKLVAEIQGGGKVSYPGGNLYKVDIPDEQIGKMLDWDKPLSQQPKAVREALERGGVLDRLRPEMKARLSEKEPLGANLYAWLSPRKTDGSYDKAAATEILRAAGIPGVRYLDGGSRGQGAGTSNYVVFDDQIPKIIGRE
jgi:hypothetical protein